MMNFSVKLITILTGCLLSANALFAFNRQDTLRGSNGRGRDWWDVQHYHLQFKMDTATKSIKGVCTIQFKIIATVKDSMQIDLQEPMIITKAQWSESSGEVGSFSYDTTNEVLPLVREKNVYWLKVKKENLLIGYSYLVTFFFEGKPREAVKPPWDGGFIWTKDSLGNPWISVACQGLGASSWWPCKDYQGDEPDSGLIIHVDSKFGHLLNTANGKKKSLLKLIPNLKEKGFDHAEKIYSYFWRTKNPINNYNATFYLGDYSSWADTFQGKKGILDIIYCPLNYNESRAKEHFKQVKKMLEAFEYWFGPYPFYEDGYKIVEAPFLGMEHQSAIAYGNNYQMGYRGKDRSGTGVGLLFDFIIVHESGHEWFGNSITATDIADNWIHEGFTTYSETLFTEYWFGKEKAFEYTRGEWKNIKNDRPAIGNYGVNDAGSGDKYDKGSALVHTIRLLMNDDEKFRAMLHKMNDTFYHKQITTRQMEDFIIGFSGLKLQPIFDQYLRTTMVPELQIKRNGANLEYRFSNILKAFELPVSIRVNKEQYVLKVNSSWQKFTLPDAKTNLILPSEFLISTKNIN
jgi:aminopeptidase N